MPITTSTYDLAHLIDAVTPHADTAGYLKAIDGILLDSDGLHLHAVATDRYTMAVARTRHDSQDQPWKGFLTSHHANALRTWLTPDDEREIVHIAVADDELTFSHSAGTLRVPYTNDAKFPDWRAVFRNAMATADPEAPLTVLSTDFLQRWNTATNYARTWQSDPAKPMVITADNFLGLQMPMRTDSGPRAQCAQEAIHDWANSLGTTTPGTTLVPVDEVLNGVTSPGRTREFAADLLKQVTHSTSDLLHAPSNDPGALAAYALAGGRAWAAYRLLEALRTVDPQLAATVTAQIDEELEGGEIGEMAWDAAVEASHDPQKWADDHAKRLASKATA